MEELVAEKLLQQLQSDKFTPEVLADATNFATVLEQDGHTPDAIFPIGIMKPDAIEFHYTHNNADAAKALLGKIIIDPRVVGANVLINGIVVNDRFTTRISIGRSGSNGAS